jgi:hypothetical protein
MMCQERSGLAEWAEAVVSGNNGDEQGKGREERERRKRIDI